MAGKVRRERSLRLEPLESRMCMSASVGWDGPGQGSASLTYYVADVPSSMGLSQDEVEAALDSALDAWAEVAAVTFTETSSPGLQDSIDFDFGPIDGSGGTLAQAYLPDDVNPARIAGDIQFDTAESWEIPRAGRHFRRPHRRDRDKDQVNKNGGTGDDSPSCRAGAVLEESRMKRTLHRRNSTVQDPPCNLRPKHKQSRLSARRRRILSNSACDSRNSRFAGANDQESGNHVSWPSNAASTDASTAESAASLSASATI